MYVAQLNFAQFIISIPLFMILFFGIGFILNMALKTTWFPAYASIIVFVGTWIYLGKLHLIDFVILISGIIGAVFSCLTINTLRKRGYRMF